MSELYRWSTERSGGNEETFAMAQEKLQEKVDFNLENARRMAVGPATYFFPKDLPDTKMPLRSLLSPYAYYEDFPKIRPLG
jgi:hypothetical protein